MPTNLLSIFVHLWCGMFVFDLACEGLDEDLHGATVETEHQVKGAFPLDVVVCDLCDLAHLRITTTLTASSEGLV